MTPRSRSRTGFTLFEVLLSLSISGLLLAGLASTLFISLKAADSNDPAAGTLRAANLVEELLHDLSYASRILHRSSQMVDFTIPDRNDDGLPERVRYEWSGGRGDPLVRQMNGIVANLAPSVSGFSIDYHSLTDFEFLPRYVDSQAATLDTHEFVEAAFSTVVTHKLSLGQFVQPKEFATQLPVGTTSWSIREIRLKAKSSGEHDGSIRVQVRTATADGLPTSLVLGEKVIAESELPSEFDWLAVSFEVPVGPLDPVTGVCLVVEHEAGKAAAEIECDSVSPIGGRVETKNGGATWNSTPTDRLAFRIIGSYRQQTEVSFRRTYLQGYTLRLQLADGVPIRQRSEFVNQPDLLAGEYSTQFSSDPTTRDEDVDGMSDFAFDAADPLGIRNGVWKAIGGRKLFVNSIRDFTLPTTIEFSCRVLSEVGEGAICHVDADWNGDTCVPLTMLVGLRRNGSQTARLVTTNEGTETTLFRIDGLPEEMNDFRLLIDPEQKLVAMVVNGVQLGGVNYELQPISRSQPQMYITHDGGAVEFDHLSVRISEHQP